jgi:dienelactone hydrolase
VSAERFVRALDGARWDDAAALVSPTVTAGAMSADALRRVWLGIATQIGDLLELGDATPADEAVDFPARFERAEVTLRVVLDDSQRVSGFWVTPPKPKPYAAPAYADASRYVEESLDVGAPPALPGVLTRPVGDALAPAVVLVHGSGPNDRDERLGANRPFRDLALGLASRGIAVLRYDKRTFAHPRALANVRITLDVETIDDAVAALDALRARPGIDPDRLFVLGHSLGATFAAEIAERAGGGGRRVAGVVMLAPSARRVGEVLTTQLAHVAEIERAAGRPTTPIDALGPAIAALAERRLPADTLLLGAPAWYWYDLDDRRPVERARALDAPLLALFGGRDYQVTAADAALWSQALAGRADATVRTYPALDHLFIAGSGPSTPEDYMRGAGHVDARVIDDVARWIAER